MTRASLDKGTKIILYFYQTINGYATNQRENKKDSDSGGQGFGAIGRIP